MKYDTRTESLIKLLGDEDSTISGCAISELLTLDAADKSETLDSIMTELQESDDRRLRKRIHQIQSIRKIRKRRRNIAKRIKTNAPNLLQSLAELHAVWYDAVDTSEISKIWGEFVREAGKFRPVTPKRLASAMNLTGLTVYEENIQDADMYCLGTVIEDRIGADIILAAIALETGKYFGLKGTIVKINNRFGVMYVTKQDPMEETPSAIKSALTGTIIIPEEKWKLESLPKEGRNVEIWTSRHVLKYAASMLLLNSVSSEGPRYVQIMASCLIDEQVTEVLDKYLPPPFGGGPDETLKMDSSSK